MNPKERALRLLVIVLGILLVIGVAVVIITIIYRIVAPDWKASDIRPRIEAAIEPPVGGELIGMTAAPDRLYLHFELPSGDRIILIVDPDTGRSLGHLRVPRR